MKLGLTREHHKYFLGIAHPGPAQHLFNLFVVWLHQHGKLQVLNGVLMSTEHLLQMNRAGLWF